MLPCALDDDAVVLAIEALGRDLDLPRDLLLDAEAVVVRDDRARARHAEDGVRLLRLRRIREAADAAFQRRARELVREVLPRDDARLQIPRAILARVVEAHARHDARALERRELDLVVERRAVERVRVVERERRAAAERPGGRLARPRDRRQAEVDLVRLNEEIDAEVVPRAGAELLRELGAAGDRVRREEEVVVAEVELDGVFADRADEAKLGVFGELADVARLHPIERGAEADAAGERRVRAGDLANEDVEADRRSRRRRGEGCASSCPSRAGAWPGSRSRRAPS